MPDIGIQVPPNLAHWWPELVAAGATDLGGLSRQRRPHLARAPVPVPAPGAQAAATDGVALTERLCVYPQYIDAGVGGPGRARRRSSRGTGASSRAAARAAARTRVIRPDLAAGAIDRALAGASLAEEELTALFAETRPEVIETMREAADELRARARRRHRHLRGQPQHQRVERLHRRLRVLRLRPGQALAGRLRALARGVRRAGARRGRLRRHRAVHPVRHPPRLGARGLRRLARVRASELAPRPAPARVLADGGRAHVRRLRAVAARGLRAAARRGAGLGAGHRRRGARTTACASASRRTSCPVGALGRDHRGRPRRRPALDGDRDVRPRRGAVGAGRAHARRARAAGAHGRLHRVRAAVVHPVPHAARPHARDRGDLARGEPQAHGGLPARARAQRSRPCRRAG